MGFFLQLTVFSQSSPIGISAQVESLDVLTCIACALMPASAYQVAKRAFVKIILELVQAACASSTSHSPCAGSCWQLREALP